MTGGGIQDQVRVGDSTAYHVGGANTVNSGSGTQVNYNYTYEADIRRKRREARFVADEEIRRLAERFVTPSPFPEHVLESPGTAVLSGPDGAGRHAAALMLLTRTGASRATGLRVLDDRPEEADGPTLNQGDISEGDRLLLDLTATDDHRVRDMQRELESYRATVADKGARLLIVVRAAQRDLLADSLAALVIRMGRPPGADVLEAHLRADGVDLPEGTLPADVGSYVDTASMREVAALARLAVEAREADPGGNAAQWLEAALTARSRRDAEAARLFREHQDGRARALLVVAAFLPRAPLDVLFPAEAAFHDLVKLPVEEGHALDGAYLAERMARVGLRVDGAHRIEFTSLALDGAIRHHFWTYFPELRDQVPDWVEAVVRLREVDDSTAGGLVRRFTEQALATGRVDHLTGLAYRWGTSGRPDLALQVLTTGLQHAERSRAFRDDVYRRSRAVELPSVYAQVLITACVVAIAPGQPTQALVRLHHFTRHRDAQVRAEALQALLDLVHQRGFQRWLLYRLVERDLRPEDHPILYGLEIPPVMARGHYTRRNLVTAWSRVLDAGIGSVPAEVLHRRLDREPELLVAACASRVRLLNDLYVAALAWVRAAPGESERGRRVDRARLLKRHIDSALGITHVEDHR